MEESTTAFKIFLRGWSFLSDPDQKSFAVLLADKLPDPCSPSEYLATVQTLAIDLSLANISNSHLSGKPITFLSQAYAWPEGQMSDDFMSDLRSQI